MSHPYISVYPTPVMMPPAGVAAHKRAQVTNVAGTLDSFIPGGIPTLTTGAGLDQYPDFVYLACEVGSANYVYWTLDSGVSTPVSTLGFVLPIMPQIPLMIPIDQRVKPTRLYLVSGGADVFVQCYFEWLKKV